MEFLPVLLEGRLDLLKGDNVEHQKMEGDVVLSVKADRGEIYFDAIGAEGHSVAPGEGNSTLTGQAGAYIVNSLHSPVFDILKKIPKLFACETTVPRVPQSVKNISVLATAWREFDVPKQISRDFEAILGEQSTPEISLSLREEKNWLNYSVSWTFGDLRLDYMEMKRVLSDQFEKFKLF